MTIREKIQLLQTVSGLTQQEIATRLNVTVVALNRWFNEKAQPRPIAVRALNHLLSEYGIKQDQSDPLSIKKNVLHAKQKKNPKILQKILKRHDLYDSFLLALTYHSNSIEGSTMTERDTAAVLFDHATLSNKTLVEQMEAKNHAAAMDYLFAHLAKKGSIDEALILKLHSILMNAIYADAGLYRRHGVRIVGSRTVTANYVKVPDKMKDLCAQLKKAQKKSVIEHVTRIHALFEAIHPFSDGNGRVGRLLMAAMFLESDFPPAIISQKKKQTYYAALEKAQVSEVYTPLEDVVCNALIDGYVLIED